MDLPKLKPCPFCGASGGALKFRKRTSDHKSRDYYSLYIRCYHCNAHGPMIHCRQDASGVEEWQKLADAWNHRAEDCAQQQPENDGGSCSDTHPLDDG